jgi:hypothetical protein
MFVAWDDVDARPVDNRCIAPHFRVPILAIVLHYEL